MNRNGEPPAVGEPAGDSGGGWQVPQRSRNGHHCDGDDHDGQVGRSGDQQERQRRPEHAAGENGPPVDAEPVDEHAARQVHHAEPALPDAQQGGHLKVAQPQGGGNRRHENREALVIQVGDSVAQGETAEDKPPVPPSTLRRLHCFDHTPVSYNISFRLVSMNAMLRQISALPEGRGRSAL